MRADAVTCLCDYALRPLGVLHGVNIELAKPDAGIAPIAVAAEVFK